MKYLSSFFRNNFLAGVLVAIPFALTILVLYWLGRKIIGLITAFPNKFIGELLNQHNPLVSEAILFLIGLVGAILIVLVAGAVARNILGRKLVGFTEYIITKIPFARTIYIASKQIVETLMGRGGMKNLKRVAMIEYPRRGIYSIGFITGSIEAGKHHNQTDNNLVSLFVPTTPNPTSGFYIMLPEEDIIELSISVEDAFRIIMSAGLATNNSENAVQGNKDS